MTSPLGTEKLSFFYSGQVGEKQYSAAMKIRKKDSRVGRHGNLDLGCSRVGIQLKRQLKAKDSKYQESHIEKRHILSRLKERTSK